MIDTPEESVEFKLPVYVIEGLDRFVSDRDPTMLRSAALKLLVTDWLLGHGYLELPPEREDAN